MMMNFLVASVNATSVIVSWDRIDIVEIANQLAIQVTTVL